jgi:hypothetical protein
VPIARAQPTQINIRANHIECLMELVNRHPSDRLSQSGHASPYESHPGTFLNLTLGKYRHSHSTSRRGFSFSDGVATWGRTAFVFAQ